MQAGVRFLLLSEVDLYGLNRKDGPGGLSGPSQFDNYCTLQCLIHGTIAGGQDRPGSWRC